MSEGGIERPACENQDCDREATLIFENWSERFARRFCQPCYNAWDRGVRTTYTQGVPRPRSIGTGMDRGE